MPSALRFPGECGSEARGLFGQRFAELSQVKLLRERLIKQRRAGGKESTSAAMANSLRQRKRFLYRPLFRQQGGEFRQPLRVSRPGRGGNKVTVNMRLVDTNIRIVPTAQAHFRGTGGISAASAAQENTSGG